MVGRVWVSVCGKLHSGEKEVIDKGELGIRSERGRDIGVRDLARAYSLSY